MIHLWRTELKPTIFRTKNCYFCLKSMNLKTHKMTKKWESSVSWFESIDCSFLVSEPIWLLKYMYHLWSVTWIHVLTCIFLFFSFFLFCFYCTASGSALHTGRCVERDTGPSWHRDGVWFFLITCSNHHDHREDHGPGHGEDGEEMQDMQLVFFSDQKIPH